jgi:hypothetical protein
MIYASGLGERVAPNKFFSRRGLKGEAISACRHQRQQPSWAHQRGRRLDGNFHVIDGSQGDTIENCAKHLGASGMDFGGEAQDADCLSEKGRLLVL